MSLSLPDEDEILAIVREEARLWASSNRQSRIKTDNITLKKLVANLKGLPYQDVRCLADDGAITEEDLPSLTLRKFELMNMDGVLHFDYSTAHLKEVGGLNTLKRWLEERRVIVVGGAKIEGAGIDAPKGVLLFGVQGGGKSLAAKAIAGCGVYLCCAWIWALYLINISERPKKYERGAQVGRPNVALRALD
ncbi:MAG: ATP-dependent 26S proteasome regulatory subunit [Lentisphaeria bacterium]